jgi:hypothetical protein
VKVGIAFCIRSCIIAFEWPTLTVFSLYEMLF